MNFMKLITLILCLGTQAAVAEYISCTITDNGSYLYLDTASLSLNIPEPLPIPGNDNFFKGTFKMTEVSANEFSTILKQAYNGCTDDSDKVEMKLFFNQTQYQNANISLKAHCKDGSKLEIYKSSLVCTHY